MKNICINKCFLMLVIGILSSMLVSSLSMAATPVANDSAVTVLTNKISWIVADCNDVDLPFTAQTQSLRIITPPRHGLLEAGSIKFYYHPDPGYMGPDSFAWSVSDGENVSNIATCMVTVAESPAMLDKLLVLVVNDLLLPEITNEIERMKLDLENEGYVVKVKSWDAGNTSTAAATDLRNYLKYEYTNSTPVLAGSIFIGNVPLSYVNSAHNDRTFWNMSDTDTANYAIWTSRVYLGPNDSGQFGDEVTLIKRYLQANHEYRTSARRVPHNAYVYDHAYGFAMVPTKQKVWPNFIDNGIGSGHLASDIVRAFVLGCDFYQEESHGNVYAYNLWANITSIGLFDAIAQARVFLASSCDTGHPEGFIAKHIFTKGGACLATVGASVTVNAGTAIGTDDRASDLAFRDALREGKSWGDAVLTQSPFFDYALMFYGDWSVVAMGTPDNKMPVVSEFVSDITNGVAPMAVTFTGSASDSDGYIESYSWYLKGFNNGMVDPSVETNSMISPTMTYAAAHNYQTRLQVTDNNGGIAYKNLDLIVRNAPDKPLRINSGYQFSSSKYYHDGYDYVDVKTNLWLHDQLYVDGTWGFLIGGYRDFGSDNHEVDGTEDDLLYQSWRKDKGAGINYNVPLPNATYTVKLGFADLINTTITQRLFNVFINGELKLQDYDIIAAAGAPHTAVQEIFSVAVTNDMLTINLQTSTNTPAGWYASAILNCFEILSVNPTVILTATPESGTLPLSVDFDGSASFDPNGPIAQYDWGFGDGNTSSLANVTHVYTNGGMFTATLTIWNDDGAPGSGSQLIVVDDPAEPDPVINSSLPADNVTVIIGSNQLFAVDVSDPEGQVLSCFWDIDGEDLSGNVTNYTYTPLFSLGDSDLGAHVISIMISDGHGGFVSHSWNVAVLAGPAPTAVAMSDITQCDVNTVVTFTGAQSTGNGTDILSYSWDFCGCGKGIGVDIAQKFSFGGIFPVRLTVTNSCGGSDSDEVLITVNDPLEPKPIITATNPVANTVSMESDGSQLFTVVASDPEGQALEYYWSVDGVVVSGTTNASYEYTGMSDDDVGEHVIEVSVWDGQGGATVVSWTVNVTPTRNHISYAESFEAYEVGTYLVSTNGWWAEDYNATIVTNDPALISALATYLQTHSAPLATNHTKILKFNDKWTNFVDSSEHPAEDIKLDLMVICDARVSMPTVIPDNQQFGCGINSNGLLMVMARESLVADPAWHILSGMTPVATGEWARLTFTLNYSGWTNMFQVQVDDGAPVVDGVGYSADGSKPGPWFVMVDQANSYMTSMIAEGSGHFDDLTAALTAGSPDNDGDGIPDDLDDDDDNDGMSDADEIAAGTDPLDSDSCLELNSVSGSGSGALVIFDSVSGKLYAIEFKDDLMVPGWHTLTSGVYSSDGTVEVYDTGVVSQRFYRVMLEQ